MSQNNNNNMKMRLFKCLDYKSQQMGNFIIKLIENRIQK